MPKLPVSVLIELGRHVAGIYDRVSQDKRRDRRSVGQQDVDNTAVCVDNGWTIGGRYVDNDRSASRFETKDRPDWERLVADLTARKLTIIVLWEVSRGERELEMWARLLNTCRQEGVLIHITSHDRTYDVRKARDWKTLAEEGVAAAYSSEETSGRAQRDARHQAAKGKAGGRIAYGYRREYDQRTGELLRQIPDEVPTAAFSRACVNPQVWIQVEIYTRAGIVREIARRFLDGQTEFRIAKDLNDRGIPTKEKRPTGWWPEHVRTLITRPVYASKRIHQGAVIADAEWPPLLAVGREEAERIHYELVALLTAPERRMQRSNAIRHLLSGIVVCGVCRHPLRVAPLASGNHTYRCRRPGVGKGKGYHVACAAGPLEAFVVEVILGRLARPDAAELFTSSEASSAVMRDLLADVGAKRAHLQTYYDRATELSAAALAAVEAQLLPQIAAAEERVKRATFAPMVGDLAGLSRLELEAEWERRDLPQQREVVRGVASLIEVLPVGKAGMRKDLKDSVRITWR